MWEEEKVRLEHCKNEVVMSAKHFSYYNCIGHIIMLKPQFCFIVNLYQYDIMHTTIEHVMVQKKTIHHH